MQSSSENDINDTSSPANPRERSSPFPPRTTPATPALRSSNLRLKRTFTDREKDDFLDEAYEFVAAYFENSLNELEKRNREVSGKCVKIDATHFDAAVYVNGKRTTHCRIWRGKHLSLGNGICYSTSPYPGDNAYNELLDVDSANKRYDPH